MLLDRQEPEKFELDPQERIEMAAFYLKRLDHLNAIKVNLEDSDYVFQINLREKAIVSTKLALIRLSIP